MDQQELFPESTLFPMDFQGAAPGDGIIYISSDESMECLSTSSVEDLDDLSEPEDDEVALLARCIERQMEIPSTSKAIPVPDKDTVKYKRKGTPRPMPTPEPTFNAGYFDLGMGRGPVPRDSRQKNNHPINVCRQLIPMVDTPLSPPPQDKYPMYDEQNPVGQTVLLSGQGMQNYSHFKMADGSLTPYMTGCTDCLVCGKSVEQIQDEAVIDYLHKTAVYGELPEQFNARRLAFLEGMNVGSFMLIPGGVSQAAACDGNLYSISHSYQRALPNTLPIN